MWKTSGRTSLTPLILFEGLTALIHFEGGREMEFAALFAAIAFIAPMCFSPGPNNLLCAAHGAQHGWKQTISLTLGMVVGWSTLGLLVAIGISKIEEYSTLFDILTWVGAVYISYLAYKVATSTPMNSGTPAKEETPADVGTPTDEEAATNEVHTSLKNSTSLESSAEIQEKPLGFKTGLTLQMVNGKAWVHFLVLMTTFGATFGIGIMAKIMLIGLNALFGYTAVLTWAAVGVTLNKFFSTPSQAKILNGFLGLMLFSVAIWIVLPS